MGAFSPAILIGDRHTIGENNGERTNDYPITDASTITRITRISPCEQ